MDIQPTLQNDLVLIRPLTFKDKEPLFTVASDPLIWEQHQKHDRWRKDQFDLFFADSLNSNGALVVLDKSKNKIIGSSRFKSFTNHSKAIEIGWSFLERTYWGGKYNHAVKTLMIDYSFQHVNSVVFFIHKNNFRSQKAAKKLQAKLTDIQFSELPRKDSLTFIIEKNKWKFKNYR